MNQEFKNIHDHQSEVDPLEIWAAIEPQVDALNEKQRKKRGLLFWFSFGMGLLTIAIAVFWIFNDGFNTQIAGITMENQALNSISCTNSTETSSSISTNSNENILTDNLLSVSSSDFSSAPLESTKNVPLSAPFKSTTNQSLINSFTINRNENITPENVFFNALPTTDSDPLSVPLKATTQSLIKSTTTNNNENILTNNDLLNVPLESTQNDFLPTNLLSVPLKNQIKFLSTSQSLPNWIKPGESADFSKNQHNKAIHLSIALQAGVSLIQPNLKDSLSLPLIRQQTETPLEASHYGIHLYAEHRSGFELSLGLTKTAIIERFDYNKIISSDTTWNQGIKAVYIGIEGDSTMIMGEIPTVTTIIDVKKIYNSYTLLEIPLILGYNYQWNKWKIAGQAGVLMNLSLKTEGKTLNNEGVVLHLETLNEPIYKTKIGLTYYFGFSLRRRIKPNIELSLSPFVRKYISDFTLKSYPYTQKYTLLGGNIGLVYTIGR